MASLEIDTTKVKRDRYFSRCRGDAHRARAGLGAPNARSLAAILRAMVNLSQ